MNYKPIVIVLGTFIIGMVVGLLLAGIVIRKQLEPVRNLQTAKGIKNMVGNITADDTTNQSAIFEVLNENIAEMQALDLEYRAEMQVNMDSLAKDLYPLLSEQQNLALQRRIEKNRQSIDQRFAKNNRLLELEQRIQDLELQITEQIKEDNKELLKKESPSNSTNSSNEKPNIDSNPSKSNAIPSKNPPIIASTYQKLVVNRTFIKDILMGYYGGNPRLINAFFTIKFNRDTSQFQNFIQQNFTGDVEQLQRVMNRQFRIKNRFRHFKNNDNRPVKPNRKEQIPSPNNSLTTPPMTSPKSSNPPLVSDPKEQTLENESLNNKTEEKILSSKESNTDLPNNTSTSTPNQGLYKAAERMMLNRILQRQFAGDTIAMQQFITDQFQGDTLSFLQTTKQKLKEQRQRRQKRRDW